MSGRKRSSPSSAPEFTFGAGRADIRAMAGYLIGSVAFALAFLLGASGLGRPRIVLALGALLGGGWIAAGAIGRANEVQRGNDVVPLWFLAGLVGFLFLIWCGGLWLGLRIRRARAG